MNDRLANRPAADTKKRGHAEARPRWEKSDTGFRYQFRSWRQNFRDAVPSSFSVVVVSVPLTTLPTTS